MLFLERIDGVPLGGNDDLTFEIQRWMITLVDTLNLIFSTLEAVIVTPFITIGTTQDVQVNTKYIPTNTALTSFQLPDFCMPGDVVEIVGEGSGGWILLTGMGQTIKLITASASTSIASAERYDTISITCVVQDTTWVVTSCMSTALIIT